MMEQGMGSVATKRSSRTRMNLRFPAFRGAGAPSGSTPGKDRTGLQGGMRAALSPDSVSFMKTQRQPEGE